MQYCKVQSNWLCQQFVCAVTEELDNMVGPPGPFHSESSNPSSPELPYVVVRRKDRHPELFGSDDESEDIPVSKSTASLDNTPFQQREMQHQHPTGSLRHTTSQTADFSVSRSPYVPYLESLIMGQHQVFRSLAPQTYKKIRVLVNLPCNTVVV